MSEEKGVPLALPAAKLDFEVEAPPHIPSAAFADKLMEEAGVIVMPGSAFGKGGEGFFRISFITSPERIAEAARRAGQVLRTFLD